MDESIVLGKDMEAGDIVRIPCSKSQRVLICGKTGTGKSYTLGVFLEELARIGKDIVLVVDAQGIFWTMGQQNLVEKETHELWSFDREPRGFRVNVLVPGDPAERYGGRDILEEMEKRGVEIHGLRLNPSDLSPEMWCELFDLDINELMGVLLFKAVRQCGRRLGRDFFIDDIAAEVDKLRGLDQTKEAIARKMEMAQDWQIFEEKRYREVWEILRPEAINVLDLSVIAQGRYGLRTLVLAVLANFMFRKRVIARRRESLGLPSDLNKIWLAIDEAHNFCPSGSNTLAKDILIRWAKEGRQPGLSLLVASQRPAAIDPEILTQCGIRVVHRITSKDDFRAVDALSQDFLGDGLPARIRRLSGHGQTLVIDDERESVIPVQVRPRQSFHGGSGA
jgi:DNA helicase HerA-like ATPase